MTLPLTDGTYILFLSQLQHIFPPFLKCRAVVSHSICEGHAELQGHNQVHSRWLWHLFGFN